MTRAEIQAFKERVGNRGTGKYLRLFDVIAQSDEYNEDLIRRRFRGDPILNNISVAKNYLFRSILDSMARTHHDEESELQSLVQKIKFLIDKGLYHHSKLLIPEAQQLAEAQEDFNMHLLVLEYERTSITLLSQSQAELPRLREIRETEQKLTSRIQVLQSYQHLLDQVHEHSREPDKLKEIAHADSLAGKERVNSLRAEILFETLHYTIARYLNQLQECISRLVNITRLFEENPRFLSDQNALVRYMEALHNLAHYYLLTDDLSAATETATKITGISEKMRRVEVIAFERFYPIMLSWSLRSGNYEEGVRFVKEIAAGKEKFGGRIQKRQEILLDFVSSLLLYNAGQLSECERYLNHIIYHAYPEIRADLQCASRIVLMVVYMDMEDYVSLENLLGPARRFLKSHHFFSEFTSAFFSFTRKFINLEDEAEKSDLLKSFLEQLNKIFAATTEGGVQNYFGIVNWVEKGIEKRSAGRRGVRRKKN